MSPNALNANPYDPPNSGPSNDDIGPRTAKLDRIARITIITALLYMAVYIPYFFLQVYRISSGVAVSPLAIFPAHFIGMALTIAALILTIRDLYVRSFPNLNAKLTWLLLILMTGGIGWIVYIFKYALKPRTTHGAIQNPGDKLRADR
jgi:hypothetical protein